MTVPQLGVNPAGFIATKCCDGFNHLGHCTQCMRLGAGGGRDALLPELIQFDVLWFVS